MSLFPSCEHQGNLPLLSCVQPHRAQSWGVKCLPCERIIGLRPRVGERRGVVMTFRRLVLTAALLGLCTAPFSFSQDKSSDNADQAAAASGKPAPPPIAAADPEKVRHDGGKNDVDAVGNRNVGC